jgi:hypothetical protein
MVVMLTIKWVGPAHHFASSPAFWTAMIIGLIVVGALLLWLLHGRQ